MVEARAALAECGALASATMMGGAGGVGAGLGVVRADRDEDVPEGWIVIMKL